MTRIAMPVARYRWFQGITQKGRLQPMFEHYARVLPVLIDTDCFRAKFSPDVPPSPMTLIAFADVARRGRERLNKLRKFGFPNRL